MSGYFISNYKKTEPIDNEQRNMVKDMQSNMLAEPENEIEQPYRTDWFPFVRGIFKVAGFLFILFLLFFGFEYLTTTPAKFIGRNYQSYTLSVNRATERLRSSVELAYVSGNYNDAIEIFERISEPSPKDQLLAAQAYLATNQPAEAIKTFNALIDNTTDAYNADAEYYLAAAYIKNSEPSKAKVLYEKIGNDKDHPYCRKITLWLLFKVDILILKAQ